MIAVVDILLLPITLYIGYKVISITSYSNIRLLIQVGLMNLTIIFDISLRIVLILDANKRLNNNSYVRDNVLFTLIVLPTLTLMLAIIINLNNWAYYSISIMKSAALKEKVIKKFTVLTWLVNIGTVLSICIVLFLQIRSIIHMKKDIKRGYDRMTLSYGAQFLTVGILFLILGIIIIHDLKKHFNAFYSSHRSKLIWAILLLSIPILITAALNMLRPYVGWYKSAGITLHVILDYILGHVMPLFTQFSSLVFGYIRKQKMEKVRW